MLACGGSVIIENPGLAFDIDAWADQIGVSRRTLTRRFRDETGLSFGAWRRRVRLLAAMTQQAQGGLVSKIAAAVGYGSPRAFQTMVRRIMETSVRTP
jgi:AraC-like DNA-binding protein